MNQRTTLQTMLGVLALVAGLTATPARADRSQEDCFNVRGIGTGVETPTGATGVVTGDLSGTVTAVALEPPRVSGDGALHWRLSHTFVTADGQFTTVDEAVLASIAPGVFRVDNRLVIVGGTGVFEGATGLLHTHGEADLIQGTLDLVYNGRICLQ